MFDLAIALASGKVNPERIVDTCLRYMEHGGHAISRALFEKNLAQKVQDPDFLADISPLPSGGYTWDPEAEAPLVSSALINRLPGDPWRGGA